MFAYSFRRIGAGDVWSCSRHQMTAPDWRLYKDNMALRLGKRSQDNSTTGYVNRAHNEQKTQNNEVCNG